MRRLLLELSHSQRVLVCAHRTKCPERTGEGAIARERGGVQSKSSGRMVRGVGERGTVGGWRGAWVRGEEREKEGMEVRKGRAYVGQ